MDPAVVRRVISAFCNEVKSIQNEILHFQFDLKSNEIVKKQSDKSIPKFQKHIRTENGVLCDYYKDEEVKFNNLKTEQEKKRPGYQTIRLTFGSTPLVMDKLHNKFQDKFLNKNSLDLEFANICWLTPLRLPEEFYYIDVVMYNNPFQGLLHSFVRHWDVWTKLIPKLGPIVKILAPIRSYLESIKNATNLPTCGVAINQLSFALQTLMEDDPIQFIDVKLALMNAQFRMHNYITENVKFDQFKGSDDSQTMLRECFNVTDTDGNAHVMTLCQSKQLFPEIDGFGSTNMERHRPVRVLNTIFFLNEAKFAQLSEPNTRNNSTSSCEDSGFFEDIDDMDGYGLQDDSYKIDDPIDKASQSEQINSFQFDNTDESVKISNFPKTNRQKLASVKFISNSELVELKKELPNLKRKITRQSIDDKFEILTDKLLLHEPMTKTLDFTGAVMTNNASQGLLHSFVRHWDQWLSRVDELKSTLKALKPIRLQLDKVKDAPNGKKTHDAIRELITEIDVIDKKQKFEVLFALLEAQLLIHQFIQEKVNTENYTLERVDLDHQCYVDYKVDSDQHLRIGVSKKYHSTVKEFGEDNRPVRFITELYFTKSNHSPEFFPIDFTNYALTPEKQRIFDYKTQEFRKVNKLSRKYSKTTIISDTELNDLKSDFDEPQPENPSSIYANRSNEKIWLPVSMPEKLYHTCAIVTFNFHAGLLHSLARHFNEWDRHIQNFDGLLEKLDVIMDIFYVINDLQYYDKANLNVQYDKGYEMLNSDGALRFARFETEMKIYKHILANVTPKQYLRVGVNNNNQIQIYFQAPNLIDDEKRSLSPEVMALCVSDELFPPVEKFCDKPHNRPVRTIITVFFQNWESYDEISAEYEEDEDDEDEEVEW